MKIDKREKYERNMEICRKKSEGVSWTELAREYHLANSVLQKIVYRQTKRETLDLAYR